MYSRTGVATPPLPAGLRQAQLRQGPARPDMGGVAKAYAPDMLRLGLFALILINVSRIHNHLGIGQFRPAAIITLAIGAYAIAHPDRLSTGKLFTHWPARVMGALAVVACFSAAFGISLGGTARFLIEEYSKVMIQAFLLIAAVRHAKDLKLLIWGYVTACGILSYFALFVFRLRPGSSFARLNHMYTFDSNDVALIIAMGLPLGLLVFQTSKGKGRFFAAFIIAGIGATMARSGSRGGFVALMAVGAALLFWTPGVSMVKRFGLIAVAAVGLLVAAPQGYWTQMNTITAPKDDYNWNTYYGRRQLAERGVGYMLEYPFFGVGIDQFPRADGTMSDRARNFVDRPGFSNRWRAAHNSYVQAGAETGMTGLILWSSLFIGGIVSLRRIRRRLPRDWLNGDPDRRFLFLTTVDLPISLLGFAVGSFFVSHAWLDPLYIMTAFVAGFYTSVEPMLGRSPSPGRAPAWRGRAPGNVAIGRKPMPRRR